MVTWYPKGEVGMMKLTGALTVIFQHSPMIEGHLINVEFAY
jgi:hypothetical protein